jgi:hypothetical protein
MVKVWLKYGDWEQSRAEDRADGEVEWDFCVGRLILPLIYLGCWSGSLTGLS